MITADNITDDQIRAALDLGGYSVSGRTAMLALREVCTWCEPPTEAEMYEAKARCASAHARFAAAHPALTRKTKTYDAPTRLPAVPVALYPEPRQVEQYDDEYLLDVAAAGVVDVSPLTGSHEHIRGLCGLIERLDLERQQLRDRLQILTLNLEAVGVDHAALVRAQDEARAARDLAVKLQALCVTVTGKTCDQVEAEMALEQLHQRQHDAAEVSQRARVQRERDALSAYRSGAGEFDLSDTIVVDPESLDEPRTKTMRDVPMTMQEVIDGE